MKHLETYFAPCSNVSTANFEHANASWVKKAVVFTHETNSAKTEEHYQ